MRSSIIVVMTFCGALLLRLELSSLYANEQKKKLKQLGVQEENEDELGLNSEHRENYHQMEQKRKMKEAQKKSSKGLSVAPSKDLPKSLENNDYNLIKTWKELGPYNPPVQLEFEADF